VLAVLALAILLDAYRQTYRVYADVKSVQPQLQQAKQSLSRGNVPPNQVFDEASASAARAKADLDNADFAYHWVAALPGLGRPMEAVKWAAAAAGQEAQAARELRGLIVAVLGDNSVKSGLSKSSLPIYKDGAINVQLLDSLTPRLTKLLGHLRAGEADVRRIPSIPLPWIGPKIEKTRATVISDSAQAIALIQKGISSVKLLPSLLGAHGTRTYFMALQNSVDQRGTGGAVLGYAILQSINGKLHLLSGGGINAIDEKLLGTSILLSPEVTWYLRTAGVRERVNNGENYSPGFPAAARAWAKLVQEATGLHVDGAIAIDPFAIRDALQGQGALDIPAYKGRIDASNVVQIVAHDQYSLSKEAQKALPEQLVAGAYKILKHPKNFFKMASGMGQAVSHRNVQMWSADPQEQALITKLGWSGDLTSTKGDYATLAYNKRIRGKQDYWTQENINYNVNVRPSGAVDSTYSVKVSDEIPPGEPSRMVPHVTPYGLNVAMLNLYVPKRAHFESVSPNDKQFPTDFIKPDAYVKYVRPRGFRQHLEGPYRVFTQTVTPYPGHPGVVQFRYEVPDAIQRTAAGRVYELTIDSQPLFRHAIVNVTVHLPKGTHVKSAGPGWKVNGSTIRMKLTLTGDVTTKIVF
jgi:hypothetical protein